MINQTVYVNRKLEYAYYASNNNCKNRYDILPTSMLDINKLLLYDKIGNNFRWKVITVTGLRTTTEVIVFTAKTEGMITLPSRVNNEHTCSQRSIFKRFTI